CLFWLGSRILRNSMPLPLQQGSNKIDESICLSRGRVMSSSQVGVMLRYLRTVTAAYRDQELPDHDLLERFSVHQDQDAYATLLKRHGAMVLKVCRSVLRNPHDAEDAFQATFLILAQKAGSIRQRQSVGGWLYQVAYRVALKAH